MYRPPENCNRVKLMRSKFENAENVSQTQDLSRQLSDPGKRNIKRTPAFRIDLDSEKNTLRERNASNGQSFYLQKVQQFNSAVLNCDTRNSKNKTANIQKPALIKSKSSLEFSAIRSKFNSEEESLKSSPNDSSLYATPLPRRNNSKPVNSTQRNNIEIINNLKPESGGSLTDTLKAALKRPLPEGPAPQKPPRTFSHAPVNSAIENRSFLHSVKDNEKNEEKSNSKHDARYMLKKLETALRNNKIRSLKKGAKETTSGEESDDNLSRKRLLSVPKQICQDLNCFKQENNVKERKPDFSVYIEDHHYEPVYAEPMVNTLKSEKSKEGSKQSLYYMSTLLLNNGGVSDFDVSGQTKADDSSVSSTMSDTGSTPSTPVEPEEPTFKIKKLIDVFETSEVGPRKQNNENRVQRHSVIDAITRRFKIYAKSTPKYATLRKGDNLFYCCLVVGWDQERPRIMFKYPPVKIPERMEDLCYPEASNGRLDNSNNAQCYSLVLTNDKGERTFGYCRRVIPEGCTRCIPLTYCILSKHRAPRFYEKLLVELESRHGIPDKMRDSLVSSLYTNSFPKPGGTVTVEIPNGVSGEVKNSVERDKLVLKLHEDIRYEEADLRCLHELPSSVILKIFASLLLERKVILISCVINKLSSCVEALQTILYPFSWPHTFIPILPQCMWGVVESPVPVICGILSVSIVNEYKIEEGIVVDLDESNIISDVGDEDSILSASMKKAWTEFVDMSKTSPPDTYAHSTYLSDAYVKVFVVALKHYRNHIVNTAFDKEGFIRSGKTKGVRRFLKWFTETTLFNSFIESVVNNLESFRLFDQKIKLYGSEEADSILSKIRNWKKP